MSDCRFGVSPVNYPDPDPDSETASCGITLDIYQPFVLFILNWDGP